MAAVSPYRPPSESSGEVPCSSPSSSTVLLLADSLPLPTPSTSTTEYETICWGCGLRLVLPSHSPIFKCGWCGAVTNQNACRQKSEGFHWRRIRDRAFLFVLLIFMSFVICGGMWAVFPVLFSVSYICGIFHCIITAILAVSTISMFSFAAFGNAGTPPLIVWGSYPVVGKGDLENYTFCQYCSKPKSPRAHHCRTCETCVLDMDHHCPFIGNCVGAANHRHFIYFLIFAVTSMVYLTTMSAYTAFHILPPFGHKVVDHLIQASDSNMPTLAMLKAIIRAFISSAVLLSARGLLLIYLFIASLSVEIGLSVLLWQQLCFIYEGKTYLISLSSNEGVEGERDCRNISHFFGWPRLSSRYLPSFCNPRKIHER